MMAPTDQLHTDFKRVEVVEEGNLWRRRRREICGGDGGGGGGEVK